MNGHTGAPLEQLVALLAEALAPRVAELVAEELRSAPAPAERVQAALVSIDDLLALLPPGRSWRRWLYEHAPRGGVPGAVKIAGRWYFRAGETVPWIEAGAPRELPTNGGAP
jgi:hypothetical protein